MSPKRSPLSQYFLKALLALAVFAALFMAATALWAYATARTHRLVYRLRVRDREATPEEVNAAVQVISARAGALDRKLKLLRWEVRPLDGGRLELAVRPRGELDEALRWLIMPARVEFRLLHPREDILGQLGEEGLPDGYEVKVFRQRSYVFGRPGPLETTEVPYAVEREPLLSVEQFRAVSLQEIGLHKRAVLTFDFAEPDAERFAAATALNARRQMAMLVDGEMFFPPKQIESAVTGGSVRVEGYFHMAPLRKLVQVLNGGALPGDLQEISRAID